VATPHQGVLSGLTDSRVLFRRERPASDVPDEHLVSLCAAGNAAALDLLFRRHGDRVFRFLGRLPMVQRRDLEDLARATFIEAYRAAGTYADRTSVSVWIVGISVGVLGRYLAAAASRATDELAGPTEPAGGTLERVARGIGDLPQELQLAFVLCDLEEIRGVEVARMLGLPRKELWARVHEARGRLSGALHAVLELRPQEAR
jgi:DNA-directed RNA polymerase specialized sigma24 family protein